MGLFKNNSALHAWTATHQTAAGIVAVLGTEALTAILLWSGLSIAGEAVEEHLRWFAVCFVPPILILRQLARKKEFPMTLKTAITTLMVTFLLFMAALLKANAITL